MRDEMMDAIVSGYVERKYFPSAVLSVYDHRGVRALSAFGDAAPDTWYDLASVTKIVATTLVLFEIEKVSLEYFGELFFKKRLNHITPPTPKTPLRGWRRP